MSALTLILVRHGHVRGIKPERFRGRTELALTAHGRARAAATAAVLQQRDPAAAIYSSPLGRCMETARAIGDAQGLTVQPSPLAAAPAD